MPNLIPAKNDKTLPTLTLTALALTTAAAMAASLAFTPMALAGPDDEVDDSASMQVETQSQNSAQTHVKNQPHVKNQSMDSVLIEPTKADYFNAADFDDNGLLNRGEFELFVDTIAESGDAIAVEIRDKAAYGESFALADLNGDKALSLQELTAEAELPESDDAADLDLDEGEH